MESLVNIEDVKYSQILFTFLSMEDDKLFEKTKGHFIKEKIPSSLKEIKTIDGLVHTNHIKYYL